MEDENPKDWFLDFPVGAILNVETGQVSDPALMDIAHEAYPFSSNSDPSHTDFLNYNTHGQLPNGGERKDLLSDGDMDPLPGVSAVTDASLYPGFIHPKIKIVKPSTQILRRQVVACITRLTRKVPGFDDRPGEMP